MLSSKRLIALAKLLGVIGVFGLLLHMGTVLYASREPRGLVSPGASGDSYEGWTGKFSGNSTKDSIYAPNGQKPVRAALVALVRNEDLYDMRKSVRELEDRWNHKYNYPYIFLNDKPFTEKFKQGIRDLTKAKVEFGTLEEGTWGYPAWIDQQRAKEEREKADYIKGGSESYRFMCRFQSGFIHKHPLLRDLEFYWRIEPEVHYYCDINYDPFVYMKKHGFKYGWNIAPDEYEPTVRTLWKTTVEFMKENPQYVADKNILDWVRNKDNTYTKCHFWSNFEIVDLSFYRSEAYQAYFDYLDRAGGFFYERWGDAPIHSIAVAMFLQKSQVHYFEDIGYYHPAMSHCPKGSKEGGSCVCNPDDGWANDFTCAKRWRAIS